MSNPRKEAFERLDGRFETRVLEPSPPAVQEPPWFADDPATRGPVPAGRPCIGPTSAADVTWDELARGDDELAAWCAERWLGTWKSLAAPPPGFAETRHSLQALAEHVLATARHRVNGKIGLRYTRAGFGTPFFGDDEQVRLQEGRLVHQQGHREEVFEFSTLGAAADAIGITCGAPDVYEPSTPLDPEMPLHVEPHAARYLSNVYGFATSVLEELRARSREEEHPSRVQLWPEHFDLAVELGDESEGCRAGYGISPGDEKHDAPYLYVVPWSDRPSDPWWNATYFSGAAYDLDRLLRESDQRAAALDFFEEGRRRLASA